MSDQKQSIVTYVSTIEKGSGVYSIHHCRKHEKKFPIGTPMKVMLEYEKELSDSTSDHDWVLWSLDADEDQLEQTESKQIREWP